MMAVLNRLSARFLLTNFKGRYPDGGGLFLNVTASGSKSWVFVWRGKNWATASNKSGRREMGLGKYGEAKSGFVTLKQARELAAECRSLVARGIDPKRKRDSDRNKEIPKTFGEVGHEFIDLKEKKWRNPKHRAQWRMSVDTYCKAITDKPITEITQADVLKVIEPLWTTRHETARRVLGRVSTILGYAIAREMREGPNPAEWKGRIEFLVEDIPPDQKAPKHHPALNYEDMPAFMDRLKGLDALAAKALTLLILSATRTSETLLASWEEFDLDTGIWVVPAERTKMRKPHAVPLSGPALSMLQELYQTRTSEYVFPGQAKGKPLSDMSMLMLLRRMKVKDVTPHGMRSSFRSWAHDKTSFDPKICEQALAHSNPDKVEAAYLRSTAFDKRRLLMKQWADYCFSSRGGKVVKLHG